MTAQQGFPQVGSPIADPKTGRVTQPWYQLIIALWNRTGGSSGTASSILDQITTAVGSLLVRGSTTWSGIAPGALGRVLTSQGAGALPIWSVAGTGTVSNVATGTGLTGGPITTTGTIAVSTNGVTNALLAQMPANTIKGNNTAGTANAADLTVSQTNALLGVTTVGTAAVGQIPGTATNDSASAGNVGEFSSASLASGSAVSLTTVTAKDVVTLSLTAGDWDIWGDVNFAPAGTTTVTQISAWVSLTSATVPTLPALGYQNIAGSLTTGAAQTLGTGMMRVSLSGTTTVYLSALAAFGTSTMSAYGIIAARRAR